MKPSLPIRVRGTHCRRRLLPSASCSWKPTTGRGPAAPLGRGGGRNAVCSQSANRKPEPAEGRFQNVRKLKGLRQTVQKQHAFLPIRATGHHPGLKGQPESQTAGGATGSSSLCKLQYQMPPWTGAQDSGLALGTVASSEASLRRPCFGWCRVQRTEAEPGF